MLQELFAGPDTGPSADQGPDSAHHLVHREPTCSTALRVLQVLAVVVPNLRAPLQRCLLSNLVIRACLPHCLAGETCALCVLQIFGGALELLRQPVINGYFIAGSLVGPGGLGLVKVCVKAP